MGISILDLGKRVQKTGSYGLSLGLKLFHLLGAVVETNPDETDRLQFGQTLGRSSGSSRISADDIDYSSVPAFGFNAYFNRTLTS